MDLTRLDVQRNENEVRYCICRSEGLDEAEMERRLLSIVYSADPALDSATGRLVPGCPASQISVRLFTNGPDAHGYHHLGGITCLPASAQRVAELAVEQGFELTGDI